MKSFGARNSGVPTENFLTTRENPSESAEAFQRDFRGKPAARRESRLYRSFPDKPGGRGAPHFAAPLFAMSKIHTCPRLKNRVIHDAALSRSRKPFVRSFDRVNALMAAKFRPACPGIPESTRIEQLRNYQRRSRYGRKGGSKFLAIDRCLLS